MARYIDADAIDYKNYNMHINGKFNRELLKDVETLEEAFYKGLVYMHNRIEETPTADVVERRKGEGYEDAKTRWIPCSERLPEHEGDYLVTFQLLYINPVEVCYFDGQAWDKGQYDAVLAWMPLPEPYSGADMRGDKDENQS